MPGSSAEGPGLRVVRGLGRSSVVAIAALVVWALSLFLDTYIPYGDAGKSIKGIYLLAFGWLALLGASVAWLANVFLLMALALRKYGGAGYALAAALFALDALRLDAYPEYGGDKPIYGYGLGVVLWLAAMGLGLVATGMRVREIGSSDGSAPRHAWVRELGFVWLAVLLTGSGVFAVKDRMEASAAERERLRSVIFKRNAVCSREPPSAGTARVSPAIVELKGESRGYPFQHASDVLRWGIPVVRENGYDYTYVGSGLDRLIRIEVARGPPTAVLEYSTESTRKSSSPAIRVRLSSAGGSEIFDSLWTPDGPSYSYCPDYRQLPRADQQPRKVIVEALGLADQGNLREPDFWATVERVTGQVTARESAAGVAWINNNAGCPDKYGFSYERASAERLPVHAFFSGGRAYLGVGPGTFAVCTDHAVYVYSSQRSSGDYFLTLSRRDLLDLRRLWSVSVKVANADPALQENQTRIVAVAEENGRLKIRTRHYGHDQFLVLEAPLRSELQAPKDRTRK